MSGPNPNRTLCLRTRSESRPERLGTISSAVHDSMISGVRQLSSRRLFDTGNSGAILDVNGAGRRKSLTKLDACLFTNVVG